MIARYSTAKPCPRCGGAIIKGQTIVKTGAAWTHTRAGCDTVHQERARRDSAAAWHATMHPEAIR